ncbi:MAG: DUF4290 domain-containing protein [Cytophagales bacterium]|nr:DUF4290 domain-containing protein [Cytophagales bacterium]
MEYNTGRESLTLKEYGRNIHKLVEFVKTVEDKEKRNKYAATLVELMKQINPNVKDSNDYHQKVWDDLFIISEFNLDAEGPFPVPNSEILDRKPNRVPYKSNEIRFRHYGRNVEIMIGQAIEMENEEEKQGAIVAVGRLMKSFCLTWNKDSIEDRVILEHIKKLSGGKLDIDLAFVEEHKLFDSKKEKSGGHGNGRQDHSNNHHHQKRNNKMGGGKRKRKRN